MKRMPRESPTGPRWARWIEKNYRHLDRCWKRFRRHQYYKR